MWLDLHKVINLAITVEEHDARLEHFLKYEIFVVVADLDNITLNEVIEGSFPLGCCLVRLCVVVDFLLSDLGVEDLFVHARTQAVRDAALGVLYEEWLVVLSEEALSDQDSFIDELLLLVHADLAHLNVEFDQTTANTLQRLGFQL